MKRQTVRMILVIAMFFLFPATFAYLSPYLIIMGAFQGIVTGSFVLFVLQALLSLVFGRAFCGWVCPAGGMQDCAALAVGKRAKGKWRNAIKYVIWAPWLMTIAAGGVAAGGFHRVDVLYWTAHGFSVHDPHGLVIYLVVVAIIAALAFIGGRRAFCHYACWMAPFMILGTRLKNALGYPSLRLDAQTDRCSGCGLCTKRCPMSLEVMDMVKKGDLAHDECILCGQCADGCPRGAIRLGFFGRHLSSKSVSRTS